MKQLISLILFFSIQSYAMTPEEEYVNEEYTNYDEIVSDLEVQTGDRGGDFLGNNKLHLGAGYTSSVMTMSGAGAADRVTLQGFQIGIGLDMFTPSFVSEITYTNFAPKSTEGLKYSLQEFGLRGYIKHHFSMLMAGRLGFGIAQRSLDIGSSSYTNPASQLFAGLEAKFGTKASIITELAYKDSLTNETPEKSSLDLSIKIDGHF